MARLLLLLREQLSRLAGSRLRRGDSAPLALDVGDVGARDDEPLLQCVRAVDGVGALSLDARAAVAFGLAFSPALRAGAEDDTGCDVFVGAAARLGSELGRTALGALAQLTVM